MGSSLRTYFLLIGLAPALWAPALCAFQQNDEESTPDPRPRSFSFAIVPQRTATELAEHWTPLLTYLKDKTGYRFDFKTARDIHTFKRRVAEGTYDLVYMNPYHYVAFRKTQGYRVFAKEKDRELTGIIVVRSDSAYRSLHDLQNQSLSFPAPTAFAASLLTRAHLDREGIKYHASFVASHDSVYLGVVKNLFAGGGGILHTLETQPDEIRSKLRVLWTSRGYTPHALAAHPRVPPEIVEKVAAAIIGLQNDPSANRLLVPLGFKGFAHAADSDYDSVRALEPQMNALLKNE